MTDTGASSWRSWRQTIPRLSANEVGRRAGISSGRMSIIERGVQPSPAEAEALRRVLAEAGKSETAA